MYIIYFCHFHSPISFLFFPTPTELLPNNVFYFHVFLLLFLWVSCDSLSLNRAACTVTSYFFCGAKDWTYDLTCDRQALYLWAISPAHSHDSYPPSHDLQGTVTFTVWSMCFITSCKLLFLPGVCSISSGFPSFQTPNLLLLQSLFPLSPFFQNVLDPFFHGYLLNSRHQLKSYIFEAAFLITHLTLVSCS